MRIAGMEVSPKGVENMKEAIGLLGPGATLRLAFERVPVGVD